MEIYEKIDVINQRIQVWQTCVSSVQSDLEKLQANIPLDEDNGGKEIDTEQRILHCLDYLDMCNRKIMLLVQEKEALTNQA